MTSIISRIVVCMAVILGFAGLYGLQVRLEAIAFGQGHLLASDRDHGSSGGRQHVRESDERTVTSQIG